MSRCSRRSLIRFDVRASGVPNKNTCVHALGDQGCGSGAKGPGSAKAEQCRMAAEGGGAWSGVGLARVTGIPVSMSIGLACLHHSNSYTQVLLG